MSEKLQEAKRRRKSMPKTMSGKGDKSNMAAPSPVSEKTDGKNLPGPKGAPAAATMPPVCHQYFLLVALHIILNIR